MTLPPKTELLLLDFDGPVCSVFAGLPASRIADEMRALARNNTVELTHSSDPLAVLSDAFRHPSIFAEVEDYLVSKEIEAAQSSELTPEADTIMRIASKTIPVCIVSNNSEPCINRFLERSGLRDSVQGIFGRPFRQPELMKPDPFLLHEALRQEKVKSERAVFVGDSLSDIDAASNAGMPIVAFANNPAKEPLFSQRQVPIITHMRDLPLHLSL
jgi:HAD superfamily hydrolase (TIGR01509 family)